MPTTQRPRAVLFLAGLLAAALLLTSTGCGFCLFQFNCGLGCCVDFRCRVPEDCPLMLVPTKSKNPPAQTGSVEPATEHVDESRP